jgi:hypothetical protein
VSVVRRTRDIQDAGGAKARVAFGGAVKKTPQLTRMYGPPDATPMVPHGCALRVAASKSKTATQAEKQRHGQDEIPEHALIIRAQKRCQVSNRTKIGLNHAALALHSDRR